MGGGSLLLEPMQSSHHLPSFYRVFLNRRRLGGRYRAQA